MDSTNGLPGRYHQQEPIRAAPHSLHHCQPGALPVWTGRQEQQQVRPFKTLPVPISGATESFIQ